MIGGFIGVIDHKSAGFRGSYILENKSVPLPPAVTYELSASETAKPHDMSRLGIICSLEATALIKGASLSRIRKKTHDRKPESGTFNKRLYQRLPDALPPCRSCDVHPSQSGYIIFSIGIN